MTLSPQIIGPLLALSSVVLLGFFAFRHRHTWKIEGQIDVYDSDAAKRPSATKFVLRCTVCGDIRCRRV